jgi:squalene-hopene/tetraprenyl-beta-curcumene cyclase
MAVDAPTDLLSAARGALERGRDRLVADQDPEGWWWGELESNATIVAEHVFLITMLGIAREDDLRRLANELRARQGADGGWPLWYDGPSDLSTTVEAYYALRLTGAPADDPDLARARALVLSLGGADRSRFFTKLWLAVQGRYPWSALPVVPPEMIMLPPRAPLSPYRFACWARGTFVALMVVLSRHPTYPQPVGLDELFPAPAGSGPAPTAKAAGRWTPWFRRAMPLARAYNRRPLRRLRARAEARIARWICDRQEADGSWGGIQPPWIYSIIALHALGYPLDHPVIAKGLAGFDGTFRVEDGERLRVQACLSPIWDTALAAVALGDAGLPPDHPALARAGEWLLAKEVDRFGDWWEIPRRGRPGGWSFEFDNVWYPDTDDTAEVLLALLRAGLPRDHPAIRRGVDWLLAMQSANGGWGAFDVDNDRRVMTQLPVCDFGEVIDPPTEDVTAHVVEALVHCGVPASHPAVRRGVAYLLGEQREDGSWWGRWGVNHIYGTGAVLPALAAAGADMRGAPARRAVEWLAGRQNADGGWGERVESYRDPAWIGRGPSTASQTAWALLALLAADPGHPAVAGGVRYLAATQRDDGTWEERQFTGTGFPADFMIRYDLYRNVFPVTALARWVAGAPAGAAA